MRALDSNILIYALTNHPDFGAAAGNLLRAGSSRTLCGSELLISELLSHGSVRGEHDEEHIRDFLTGEFLRLVPVTAPVLHEAARLRREHRLALADAIHLASAVISGADSFVTNDHALLKLSVPRLNLLGLKQVTEPDIITP